MPRLLSGLILGLCATVLAAGPPIDRLGAIGDSLTDEYFEESYDYARNWTVLVVDERGLSFGPTAGDAGEPGGTWDEPRRTGYEDNWARSGATIDTALSSGQHLGVADGILNRGVSHVIINIGINDFFGGGAYGPIYLGLWTPAEIEDWIADRMTALSEIVDSVVNAGAGVVLMSVLDPSVTPAVQSIFTDPDGREDAALALAQWRDQIRELAATRKIAFVDQFALARAIFGTNLAPRAELLVGNVAIDLTAADTTTGTEPTAAFVDDAFHPNTVPQAIEAALIMTALNLGYGAGLVPFSEDEMLSAAGIAYGGSDTLDAEIGPLSDFVAVFVEVFSDGFESGDTAAWTLTVP